MNIKPRLVRVTGLYGALAAFVVGLICFFYRVPGQRWDVPIFYHSDAFSHLMIAKSLITNGWWWNIPELSAPYGLEMVAYPVGGNVDLLIMTILARVISTPGGLVNAFWILSVALAAVTACWSLERLGISKPIAFVVGVAYACLPHVFYRNVMHLMLMTYLVPPVAAWAVLLITGGWRSLSRLERGVFLAFCALLGFNYPYAAFFGAVCLATAGIAALVSRQRDSTRRAVASLVLLIAATGLSLAPTWVAWKRDPDTGRFINSFKAASAADIFGLKLRQLLTPVPEHRIGVLRWIQEKVDGARFPMESENSFSRLGLLGAIGFCWLTAFAIFGRGMAAPEIAHSREFSALSALTLTLLLLSTVGGVGSLFNVFVSPDIRCYNRSSVFIAFYSLAAFAMLLGRLPMLQRIRNGIPLARSSLPPVALLGALLLFCVFDQDASSIIHSRRVHDIALYDLQKDFVRRVESRLSPGSRVYQIPFAEYPITDRVERIQIQVHLAAYLLSRNGTQWSWPAISSEARAWNLSLDPLNAVDFVGRLREAGFAGLWVDRQGFDSQTLPGLEAGLQQVLGAPVETAKDRYAFYLVNSAGNSRISR